MNKHSWFLVLILLLSPATEANEAPLLSVFVGSWQAEGEAFGAPSISEMVWSDTALGGKFFRLEYRIDRPASSGPKTIFSGLAYYQKSTSGKSSAPTIKAFWADTNGNLHPVSATIDGHALVAEWGTPDTEQGRTRYQLKEQNVMEVTDWVKTTSGWQQFNQTIFSRPATNR